MVCEMENHFSERLETAQDFADIFDIVKDAVRSALGRSRAGLMLGLSPLGFAQQGFIGAYHQVGSNLIVMNSSLLKRIQKDKPEMMNYYIFHLLMHEYLHSLGVLDEARTRAVTYMVSKEVFGMGHMVTKIAEKFEAFLPNLVYPGESYKPPDAADITLIPGFDKEGTSYIG